MSRRIVKPTKSSVVELITPQQAKERADLYRKELLEKGQDALTPDGATIMAVIGDAMKRSGGEAIGTSYRPKKSVFRLQKTDLLIIYNEVRKVEWTVEIAPPSGESLHWNITLTPGAPDITEPGAEALAPESSEQ